jgi:RecG-like helicase
MSGFNRFYQSKGKKDYSRRAGKWYLSILVGTHAVLEDKVKFKNLGLAIIDEQHRFGVAQRAKLWAKNKIPPHILVMTALLFQEPGDELLF